MAYELDSEGLLLLILVYFALILIALAIISIEHSYLKIYKLFFQIVLIIGITISLPLALSFIIIDKPFNSKHTNTLSLIIILILIPSIALSIINKKENKTNIPKRSYLWGCYVEYLDRNPPYYENIL